MFSGFKKFSFSKRSQLWTLGAVAVFAIVVANLAWLMPTLNELEVDAWLLHRATAIDIKNQLSAFLSRQEKALEDAADILNQRRSGAGEITARLLKENQPIESISFLDLAGREIYKKRRLFLVSREDLYDRSGDALWREVLEGKIYRGPVLISANAEPVMTIAVPLGRETGFSALVADINLKFLLEVVRNINVESVGRAYVVDRDGFLISHPDSSLVLARTNVLERKLILGALFGEEGDTRDRELAYRNENGDEVFAVALPFELTGWAVAVEDPRSRALASSQRILNVAVISFGIEILLTILLIWNYFKLAQSAELFMNERNQREAILASLYDGVIEYDDKFRVVLMNARAEELLGVKFSGLGGVAITPELLKTRPELKALTEVMYPALAAYASAAKEIPGSTAKTMEIHTSSPELRLLVTLTQVEGERGEVRGFLKILHDVSREELIGRIKSEFVSIAAHQLRTPLSAIKWTLRLLLDGDAGELGPEQVSFLQKGYMTNERMIKLVNDLLSAARIEEGKFGYEFKEMDLAAFCETVLAGFGQEALEHKVSLSFEKPSEKLPPAYADPEKLSLALTNLIENAVKYTPEGGRVRLALRRENDFAVLSVSDSGVGIPKADRHRVFSKFFRASNVIRMETEGTGLGLFIVKNIIKRHGGEISFVSEEGKGTTFTFTLPFNRELVPREEKVGLEEFLESV